MHVYKITKIYTPVVQLKNTDACHIKLGNLAIVSIQRSVFKPMFSKEYPESHKFYKPTTASDWHKIMSTYSTYPKFICKWLFIVVRGSGT